MFKQIIVLSLFIFLSYFTCSYILKKNYCKFYYIDSIIKYPLNCKIKNVTKTTFRDIELIDNYIFYTLEKINCKNYIYDKILDCYYLIEPGYYYYIKNKKDIELHFNPNTVIYYFKIKFQK